MGERRIAYVDASGDLFLTTVIKPSPLKLAAVVDSIAWHASVDILAALADGALVAWLAPVIAHMDNDLCAAAKVTVDPATTAHLGWATGDVMAAGGSAAGGAGGGAPLGGSAGGVSALPPSIVSFAGSRVTVRRGDGSTVQATVSLYAPLAHECAAAGKWPEALRLARFVGKEPLWAAVAALALNARQADAAAEALAALGAVDKLAWVTKLQSLQSTDARAAEWAVYRRQHDEAEAMLLQATPVPLVYRAIKMNVKIARWERALQLAQQNKVHVDTVLLYRRSFLAAMGRAETLEPFLRAAAAVGELDVEAIKVSGWLAGCMHACASDNVARLGVTTSHAPLT